jgi:3-hydroxybutyryl-CoA dehydrogenase
MSERNKAGVVGAGTMGSGIAHVFARSGYQVLLCDLEPRFLDRGLAVIKTSLEREVAKGSLSEQAAQTALRSIRGTLDRQALAECEFVIEAATERFAIKQEIFQELDRVLDPQAILASNTSSISITRLAAQTTRPARVIGMHFFNPVPVMKLVEVVRGLQTRSAFK